MGLMDNILAMFGGAPQQQQQQMPPPQMPQQQPQQMPQQQAQVPQNMQPLMGQGGAPQQQSMVSPDLMKELQPLLPAIITGVGAALTSPRGSSPAMRVGRGMLGTVAGYAATQPHELTARDRYYNMRAADIEAKSKKLQEQMADREKFAAGIENPELRQLFLDDPQEYHKLKMNEEMAGPNAELLADKFGMPKPWVEAMAKRDPKGLNQITRDFIKYEHQNKGAGGDKITGQVLENVQMPDGSLQTIIVNTKTGERIGNAYGQVHGKDTASGITPTEAQRTLRESVGMSDAEMIEQFGQPRKFFTDIVAGKRPKPQDGEDDDDGKEKSLTRDIAKKFLAEAGGDKEKARAAAKAAGYKF